MEECRVCGDRSTGNYYGAHTCDSCRLFFKRSIRKHVYYSCKLTSGSCPIDRQCRNMCQYCRMKRCVAVGMREEDTTSTERYRKHHYVAHHESRPYRVPENIFDKMLESDSKGVPRMHCPRVVLGDRRRESSDVEPTDNHIETASRLLFKSIKWAKSLPYFAELYYPDQLELLRQNWSKLFLFNLMHSEIVPSIEKNGAISKAFKQLFMRWSQVNLRPDIPGKFDYSLEKIRRLQMDETEAWLIKSLLLFNPETEGLVDTSQVQVTQNKCHRALEDHALSTNPSERDRSGRILLTILTLSTFEERDIESIFLSTVLGNATVTSLMENILCADAM